MNLPAFHLPLLLPTTHPAPTHSNCHPLPNPPTSIASTPRPPQKPRTPSQPPIPSLHGAHHITTTLNNPPHSLTLLLFHAKHCRTCKTLIPRLGPLSKKFTEVAFYLADYMEDGNKEVANDGGVRLLPTIWIVGNEGKRVDSFCCGPFGSRVVEQRLREALVKVGARTEKEKEEEIV